uniref:Uncharacterized protein n=1 Tax=Parascaris equorum TaxID=6256 RepID=A0A914R1Y6_PAREQ
MGSCFILFVLLQESEYRRFKSEGSAAGTCSLPAPEMDVTIDDLSPIADPPIVETLFTSGF